MAGFDERAKSKTPKAFAEECQVVQEFELLVAYFDLKNRD